MTIRHKLLGVMALNLVLLLAIGGFAITQMDRIQNQVGILQEDTITSIGLVNQIGLTLSHYQHTLTHYTADSNDSEKAETEQLLHALEREMDALLGVYGPLVTPDEDEERLPFTDFQTRWSQYVDFIHREVLPSSQSGDQALAQARLHETMDQYDETLDTAVTDLMRVNQQQGGEVMESVASTSTNARTLMIAVIFLAVVLACGIGFALATGVARNIQRLIAATSAVAGGDFSASADVRSRDELGVLASALRQMTTSLGASFQAAAAARATEQALRESEAADRQRLEQAVATYIAFVQRVAQGDLSQRLTATYEGALGQLAQGLNGMVASLERAWQAEMEAQSISRQLQAEETATRAHLEQAVATYLAFAQQVAQGDLSQRLPTTYEGALGQLAQGLNGMVASLHQIAGQVRQATNAIAATASDILSATTQQVASAAEQSAALSQTVATVAHIKATAAQTAEQASSVAQESQRMIEVAQQGTAAVEETISGMQQVHERVTDIAHTITGLAERNQAISTIISTVAELADQSNLLALNAAIEAARAGAQGKSFAVVAQHVRDLAERSKAATAQIRSILGDIRAATEAAVRATEEGTTGATAGSQLATQAGATIHDLTSEVDRSALANMRIAAAAQQQMGGMDQIGQAIGTIQQSTNRTLASTRQAEQAAQNLHDLAQSLQQAIAIYQL